MKKQTRRPYTAEFKAQAVELLQAGPRLSWHENRAPLSLTKGNFGLLKD